MIAFDPKEPHILDENLLMLREQLRRFVNEKIVPHGETWEAEERTPRELFRELGALGFLGLRHPVEYGGGGLGALATVVFNEELSRSGFCGIAAGFSVHADMSTPHIAHRGTDAQKAKYLPGVCTGDILGAVCVTEPHAGSDVAGLKTRATRVDDGWIINGSKTFITNGASADVYIVAARTDPEAKGSRGISLFLVDRGTPGLQVARKLKKHGWYSSDTAELYFEDMKVPADALLGEEGKGFYYIMSTFQNERLTIGAMCAGVATRAVELTIDYLRSRQAFGKTLWEQPVVRNKIALMATKAQAARALTYQCAQMIDEGQDVVREVSMLKVFAAETLQEIVHTCLQLHGGAGFMMGTPIERLARDARVMTIGGGATEVMLEEVAKRL